MDENRKLKINTFIKELIAKGTSRSDINRQLKITYNVKLANVKHTGLKQRLRNLMNTGLTRDEALGKLVEFHDLIQ